MKIAVITTSRGRPAGLVTTINALETLRSKEHGHEVRYFVRVDDDDIETGMPLGGEWISMFTQILPESVKFVHGPRTATLGQSWNEALDASKEWDWDVVTFFPDDVIPLTPGWDECFRVLVKDQMIEACCWTDSSDPNQPSYFILTRKYLEALGGHTSTEFFPFWFDDTWVAEVHKIAFGVKIPIVGDMAVGGFNPNTTSMWDLRFWTQFWIATRVLRFKQAIALREAYGAPEPDMEALMAMFAKLDAAWDEPINGYPTRIACIEDQRAERGERTPRYLAAKAKAEAWLAEIAKNPQGVLESILGMEMADE